MGSVRSWRLAPKKNIAKHRVATVRCFLSGFNVALWVENTLLQATFSKDPHPDIDFGEGDWIYVEGRVCSTYASIRGAQILRVFYAIATRAGVSI